MRALILVLSLFVLAIVLWDAFETKSMPTNILVSKGGTIVTVVKGCKRDGSNAEAKKSAASCWFRSSARRRSLSTSNSSPRRRTQPSSFSAVGLAGPAGAIGCVGGSGLTEVIREPGPAGFDHPAGPARAPRSDRGNALHRKGYRHERNPGE